MLFCYNNKKQAAEANKGLTLLECVIALGTISLLVLVLMGIIKIVQRTTEQRLLSSELTWHLFLIQLANTSATWQLTSIEPKRIVFQDMADEQSTNVITIEKYHNQLKKQKRGGYDVLLLNIADVIFYETGEGIALKVVMEDSKTYEALFPLWAMPSNQHVKLESGSHYAKSS